MKRTFIDAGVLIAAARGENTIAVKAMAILDDPEREFVSSEFVRLEVDQKQFIMASKLKLNFTKPFSMRSPTGLPHLMRSSEQHIRKLVGLAYQPWTHST